MAKKIKNFSALWHSDAELNEILKDNQHWDFTAYDSLEKFMARIETATEFLSH